MRCNFCGAEWTLPYKATFEDCPFCLRPLGKTNHNVSGNPLSDFDIVGTVLRAYKGTNPVVVVPSFITELGSVTSGRGTFEENTVIEKVVLPDTISEIPGNTFYGCTSLREIVFPKSLKRIGQQAFYRCTALTKIVIPDGVEEIGSGAFSYCIYLEKVVIPESLKHFDSDWQPFIDCKRIRHIECPGPMLGIFAKSSKYADEFREENKLREEQRRERERQERSVKLAAGICPYCGRKLGLFSIKCKYCGRG